MKITLLMAALIIAPTLIGCGSDAPAPVVIENNGVKPVPDYGALIKAEQAARDKANGVITEDPTEKK